MRCCVLVLLLLSSVTLGSCYRDTELDKEMEELYAKSVKLKGAPQDSINIFTYALRDYVNIHPEAARHPRFLQILENLYKPKEKETSN